MIFKQLIVGVLINRYSGKQWKAGKARMKEFFFYEAAGSACKVTMKKPCQEIFQCFSEVGHCQCKVFTPFNTSWTATVMSHNSFWKNKENETGITWKLISQKSLKKTQNKFQTHNYDVISTYSTKLCSVISLNGNLYHIWTKYSKMNLVKFMEDSL